MHARLALAILVLQCLGICAPIRVPIVWNGDDSEVHSEDEQFSVEQFKPQNVQKTIPVEYFEYTAKKPQFAVDIAAFHGVQSPENHFAAHAVRPFTGKEKPTLGQHRIQEENRPVFHQFQDYINHDSVSYVSPVTTEYSVFHPYKSEEPGLQELYKDPILDKIRNDIRDSSQRLQTHENEAEKPDISKDEYLESLEQTDFKKAAQKNIPAPYEIHRPQRRPVYYRPIPKYPNRDHILNQRFRHPWNQNFVKIRPLHYRPLKNHIQRLRQHHALTYADEHNEYPQVSKLQPYEETSDGYDIYEKGKEKYANLRNNLDESVNNLVNENRPIVSQKLELQRDESPEDEEEEEFVPIKNYAQIRKTETTRHLPKVAAFEEAENYEELKNAPRLREAVKSTKAQTVYTEEGYEDSAYDHAGEQKHASDNEAHGGFLRENELSGGKYKIPSVSASYKDGNGSAYKDQIVHEDKWNENNNDNHHEEESDDYTENEHEHSIEADSYREGSINNDDNKRNKRQHAIQSGSNTVFNSENKTNDQTNKKKEENDSKIEDYSNIQRNKQQNNDTAADIVKVNTVKYEKEAQHDMNKRETKFKVPEIDVDSTYLNEKDILQIAKEKIITNDDLVEKYPYYFKNIKSINKDSPLKYAENFKLIPKKSNGGTEFYDSRSHLECPEVDDRVDALPEKFKKNGHPDEPEEGETEEENKEQSNKSESIKAPPRLEGLGDKIDCFKAKYFGVNPLDSPFFKEETISKPDPVVIPNLPSFHLKSIQDGPLLATSSNKVAVKLANLKETSDGDIYGLLDKLKSHHNSLKESFTTGHLQPVKHLRPNSVTPLNILPFKNNNVSIDIISNKNNSSAPQLNKDSAAFSDNSNTYNDTKSREFPLNVTIESRKKRSAPFLYEPYKIIRDIQSPDSKKTTTTGNISPLIKQLQTSKVINAVVKSNNDKEQNIKRIIYKDIGRKDRENVDNISSKVSPNASFVDVNVDKRRGEPRYELRPLNHKAEYSPVINKKSISLEEYKAQTNPVLDKNSPSITTNSRRHSTKLNQNVANNFQQPDEFQNLAASSTVKRTIATSPPTVKHSKEQPLAESKDDDDSEEDYDEDYEDDDEEEKEETSHTTTTSTTTTPKPTFRKRIRTTTTTEKPGEVYKAEEPTKLRLVTRFRNHNLRNSDNDPLEEEKTENIPKPKLREKKKKITKSTIVTDTQKYGDGEDDMRQEEIDALIGVKHDMRDYMPMYEKEAEIKNRKKITSSEEDDSDENDDDDDVYEKDDEEEEELDKEDDVDDDDRDNDDDDDDEKNEDDIKSEIVQTVTTTESSKRTLYKTTDAPHSTTETRSFKVINQPIISKKKIEIHKELPVNKTSPHVTQFKQDIKEVEIIREIPRKIPERKTNKNVEVFDLYKDDNLATDINKLGAVEIFKENLDLHKGPKHGGNYRRAPTYNEEVSTKTPNDHKYRNKAPKDAEVSQTENKRQVELDDSVPSISMHGGNLKHIDDTNRSSGIKGNAKLIEFKDDIKNENTKSIHGRNLRTHKERGRKRGESRSEKLVELDDDASEDDDSTSGSHEDNFRSYGGNRNNGRAMHGGNYRRSKLIQADNVNDESINRLEKAKNSSTKKLNSADLLISLAQAVPILTTTPAYILDPSKRMYYYVDA